ncbi:DNA starvation/stationary phase protection protein [Candidatus Woesearchaeota archaeon]|nr:DNA starvation/stationary phase protection protein [Candidatus Woesearchaeota archaeon]
MEIGISKENVNKVGDILQKVLSNQHVLYQKLRNFHWNVTGKEFIELHKFFEDSYNSLSDDIDVVAERIRSLGLNAKGTMAEYLELADLKESPGKYPDAGSMTKELLNNNELLIVQLRESSNLCGDLGDSGNEDVLIGLMENHEKQAWMLRSMT